MKKRICLLTSVLLLATMAALADESKPVDTGTMVVTAQKFNQEETRAPVGMDAFSGEALYDRNIHTLKDLSQYAGNVHIKADNAGNATVIRGIAPFTATLAGPAGIFIDGVALPTVFMQQPELLAVERVEILKGPQGTLYGSNTESGVINIITARPDNLIQAAATAEYYLYDTDDTPAGTRLGASLRGPLIRDKLYIGASAVVNRTDGCFENLYNQDDKAGQYDRHDFHFKLRHTPTTRLEINLAALYLEADDAKGKFRYSSGPAATPRYHINYNDRYDQSYSGAVTSLAVEADLNSGLSLHSITGFTLYERDFAKDFDGTPADTGLALFDLDDRTVNEELRLQSTSGRWLAGVYIARQDSDVLFEKTGVGQRRTSDIITETFALFGQYTLPVTENNSIDLGLRAERTEVSADMKLTTSGGDATFTDEHIFDQLLPKISWKYLLEDGIVYLSVAKGYLAGGVNYNLATSKQTLLYGSEESISYEIGYKQAYANGRHRLAAALFYVAMDDKQITRSVAGEMGAMKIDNAGRAYAYGAEVEWVTRPLQGLELFLNGGWTQAEAQSWSDEDYDYAGNRLPYVPRYTAAAGISYLHDSGLFGRGDITATGSFYHDGANTLKENATETVNLSVGYLSDHYTLTLWCKNLFDHHYAESATYWGLQPVVEDAAPRIVALKLDYRF